RCTRSRWRCRPISPASAEPKNSWAYPTKAAINSDSPSPRRAEIANAGSLRFGAFVESRSILLRTIQVGASLSVGVAPSASVSHSTRSASAAHALLLHGIIGLANPGGVDHRHRIAVEIELHLDDIARGAGMRGDDRDFTPRELVHQRRLADIRRTRDRDHKPVAQAFSSALCRKHFFDFAEQRFDLRERRRDQFAGHVTFVGEVDAGLDQRGSLDDLRPPVSRLLAKQTLEMAERLAALAIGVGMNEIVEAFGFGQIELAVLERAPRELAGLGRADILDSRQCREQ